MFKWISAHLDPNFLLVDINNSIRCLQDIRQLQITEGNITKNLEKYLPYTGTVIDLAGTYIQYFA